MNLYVDIYLFLFSNCFDQIQHNLQRSNLYHHIELNPLAQNEAEVLIAGYYKQAGFESVPISMQKIAYLWQLSEGVPGKLLEFIELEKQKQSAKAARFPFGHIVALLLIGSALLVSLFFNEEPVDIQDDAIAALLNDDDNVVVFASESNLLEVKTPVEGKLANQRSEKVQSNIVKSSMSKLDRAAVNSSEGELFATNNESSTLLDGGRKTPQFINKTKKESPIEREGESQGPVNNKESEIKFSDDELQSLRSLQEGYQEKSARPPFADHSVARLPPDPRHPVYPQTGSPLPPFRHQHPGKE